MIQRQFDWFRVGKRYSVFIKWWFYILSVKFFHTHFWHNLAIPMAEVALYLLKSQFSLPFLSFFFLESNLPFLRKIASINEMWLFFPLLWKYCMLYTTDLLIRGGVSGVSLWTWSPIGCRFASRLPQQTSWQFFSHRQEAKDYPHIVLKTIYQPKLSSDGAPWAKIRWCRFKTFILQPPETTNPTSRRSRRNKKKHRKLNRKKCIKGKCSTTTIAACHFNWFERLDNIVDVEDLVLLRAKTLSFISASYVQWLPSITTNQRVWPRITAWAVGL